MRGESPQISAAGSEILVYEAPDGEVRVDVRLEEETVWLSLNQMAELFGRDKSVISRHLRNVFQSGVLDHATATAAIAEFRQDLMSRKEASELFGNPRGDALEGILGNIEQTMFGEPLYTSREHKAAHFLYFVVKDHPFSDGNKRIGSLLFLLYLKQEGIARELVETVLEQAALLSEEWSAV